MVDRKQDVEFLKAQLKRLRERYKLSFTDDFDPRWRPSKLFRVQAEAKQERVARLADAHGFDGGLFRDYLFRISDYDITLSQAIRRLRKQMMIIPRIIAKIEEADQKADTVATTTNRPQLETDEDRLQVTLNDTTYDVSDEQLRILKRLADKPGVWITGKNLRGPVNPRQRVDKIINRLHPNLRNLIESHTRNGYRLKDIR